MIGVKSGVLHIMQANKSGDSNSICLVVGAGGFIGFNLCEELLTKYDKVYACDSYFPKHLIDQLQHDNVIIIEGGVESFVLNQNKYYDIEDIYYFAGKSAPSLLEAELDKGYFTDQTTLVMLLEAAVDLKNFCSFIYGSSGGTIYGDSNGLACNEDFKTNPISAYGLSKLTQENYIEFYARRFGYKAKIARISNPYGRLLTHGSKQLQGFIDNSVDKVANKQQIEIWGDGGVVRDYIHINDLILGISALASKSVDSGIYNIGSGIGSTLNEIIAIYMDKGEQANAKYIDSRQIDLPVNILEINKIKNSTGWQPLISLEQGVIELLEYKLNTIEK